MLKHVLIALLTASMLTLGGTGCGSKPDEMTQIEQADDQGRSLSRRQRELLEEEQQEAAMQQEQPAAE